MRKLLVLLLLLAPGTLFAQDWDRDRDRDRWSSVDNSFELTPFGGYRYGGTIFADQTDLFNRDVDVKSNPNLGLNFGIPLGRTPMKLELMVNRQSTELENGGGLFSPNTPVADMDITYYHAGLLFPFAMSRTATPFVIVSAGVANLDPQIRNVSNENRFSASAGVGVKVPFNRNIGLRLEARGYYTSMGNNDRCSRCSDYYYDYNHDLYQGETNVGLVFSF